MDRATTLSVIEDKLEVICEQFDIIRQYDGRVPAIELDLMMGNIREVYEFLLYFEKQNQQTAYDLEEGAVIEPPLSKSSKEKKTAQRQQQRAAATRPAEAAAASAQTGQPEVVEESTPVIETVEPDSARTVVFDLFADSPSQPDVIAEPDLPSSPDIRSFIGINEKFRFINELFDGNLRIYDETIQKLNRAGSSTESDMILTDLKEVFSWKTGEETAQLFRNAVMKRF